jgi:hypothetical protein
MQKKVGTGFLTKPIGRSGMLCRNGSCLCDGGLLESLIRLQNCHGGHAAQPYRTQSKRIGASCCNHQTHPGAYQLQFWTESDCRTLSQQLFSIKDNGQPPAMNATDDSNDRAVNR